MRTNTRAHKSLITHSAMDEADRIMAMALSSHVECRKPRIKRLPSIEELKMFEAVEEEGDEEGEEEGGPDIEGGSSPGSKSRRSNSSAILFY